MGGVKVERKKQNKGTKVKSLLLGDSGSYIKKQKPHLSREKSVAKEVGLFEVFYIQLTTNIVVIVEIIFMDIYKAKASILSWHRLKSKHTVYLSF